MQSQIIATVSQSKQCSGRNTAGMPLTGRKAPLEEGKTLDTDAVMLVLVNLFNPMS